MWNELITVARYFRRRLYEISTSHIYGVDVDIILHFVFGALVFAWVARRWDNRTASWTLAICIVAKEIFDLFAKSSIDYIHMPTAHGRFDTIKDVAFGALGGLCVWLWQKWRASRN